MRLRRAAVLAAAMLTLVAASGPVLALQPAAATVGLDGVERGSSGTFDLADGGRVHVLRSGPVVRARARGARVRAAAGTNGISYHGGPIVATEHAVAIYWSGSTIYSGGPTPGTTGTAAADGSLVGYFLGNLGGSPYYNINTTYTDTVGGGHTVANALSYSGYWADNAGAPSGTQNVSDASIQAEIVNGFTSGKLTYDPSTVYAVFSSGAVNLGGGAFTQYCAYHGDFTWNGQVVLYAAMPYDWNNPAACSALSGSPNGDSAADTEVSVLAHELEEANTDPQLNAWYDTSGYENADKCAWTFGTTYTSGGGQANIRVGAKDFLVQQNWLNANGGACVQGYASPVPSAPGAPTLGSATAGVNSVKLSWTAPANPGSSPITGYDVYRSTASGLEGTTPYATVGTVTSYTDAAATAGATYYYTVDAVNAVGASPQSNERSATPLAVATAPSAPVLNSATAATGSVTLSWSVPASDGGSAITGYTVYRGASNGGETPYASLGIVTSYRDTAVTGGSTYFYTVVAVNGVGPSGQSNERSATVPIAAVPGAPVLTAKTASFNRGVQLSWTAPSGNGSAITAYRIYRSTSSHTEVYLTQRGSSSRSYRDSNTVSGTTYYYVITAVNANGEGPVSNEAYAKAR